MAKKNNDADIMMKNVELNKKIAQRAQDNLDNVYKSTFYTDTSDKKYIDSIRNMMNQSLNSLIDKTRLRNGETNISELYARTLAQGDKSLLRQLYNNQAGKVHRYRKGWRCQ